MDNYKTPDWILRMFEGWFDPCPLKEKPEFDGLAIEWRDKTFVNPPYSAPSPWVEKAIEESKRGKIIAILLKADLSTRWASKLHQNGHIFFLNERIKFEPANNSARFPSMLIILESSIYRSADG